MYGEQSITSALCVGIIVLCPRKDKLSLITDELTDAAAEIQRRFAREIARLRMSTPRSGHAPPASWDTNIRSLIGFEREIEIDGESVSAGVFDVAVAVATNKQTLETTRGRLTLRLSQPVSNAEWQLWRAVLDLAQVAFRLPDGSLRLSRRRVRTKRPKRQAARTHSSAAVRLMA
jgi:hypothetical protein